MSNLTVSENKALAAMPVSLQPLVQARFKKPIRDYGGMELETAIKNMLLVAFTELGHTTSAQDDRVITFLRETLLKDLKKPKFSGLTLEAIHLFISNGIRGEYGTFKNQLNTINIQNIHHWIRMGQETREWKQSLEEFNRVYLEMNTSEVPLQVKIKRSIEGVISAFEYYKTGEDSGGKHIHRLPFCGFAYYDILNDLVGQEYTSQGRTFKTLITDPKLRESIVKRSVKAYREDLKKKEAKARFQGKNDLADQIASMFAGSGNKSLENKIKEKMLTAYFDALIKAGKDIREILKTVKIDA